MDGEQINDSAVIMREMETRMKKAGLRGRGARPRPGSAAAKKEDEWFAWVDSRFVHVVTPNIYRTWEEAQRSFDYITERGNFNWFTRQAIALSGAASMYVISHRYDAPTRPPRVSISSLISSREANHDHPFVHVSDSSCILLTDQIVRRRSRAV